MRRRSPASSGFISSGASTWTRCTSKRRSRSARRADRGEEIDEAGDLVAPAGRRPALGDPFAEHADPDPLEVDQAHNAEGRGDPDRTRELARRTEAHRRRRVDDQVQAEILLVDEQLDVQTVEAPVDVPVDVAEVVAYPVGAIVAELDAVPAPEAAALA